jgi:drug/metabolite transporter (DMT)-like permease
VNTSSLLIALVIAVGFAGWPIIGRYSQASGVWIGTFVMAGTTVVMALLSGRQLAVSVPSPRAFAVLAVAAALNGLGVYLYSFRAADPAVPIGLFVVVVAVLTIVAAPMLDWALHGAVPSPRQMAGILCAAGAVYLLGR